MAKKESELAELERRHPGVLEQLRRFESAVLPACSHRGAAETADVQVGLIGRTVALASLTKKFKLVANGPKKGNYFCNACEEFFD